MLHGLIGAYVWRAWLDLSFICASLGSTLLRLLLHAIYHISWERFFIYEELVLLFHASLKNGC